MTAQVWNRVEKETAEALTPVEPALSGTSRALGVMMSASVLNEVRMTQ